MFYNKYLKFFYLVSLILFSASCIKDVKAVASSTNVDSISVAPTTDIIVTFNANGGTGPLPLPLSITNNTPLVLPSQGSLSRVGYTFMGWGHKNTTIPIPSGITLTQDTILYALWGYIISFQPNGGVGTVPYISTIESTVVLPSSPSLTRSGYRFLGWNKTSNATTVLSNSYTGSANTILYTLSGN